MLRSFVVRIGPILDELNVQLVEEWSIEDTMTFKKNIASKLVEFNRLGGPEFILSPSNRYIRTTGWGELAAELSPDLGYEELLMNVNLLRYDNLGTADEVRQAREVLATQAMKFLPYSDEVGNGLLQIDLVTNAAELWAFPFEACFARNPAWLERPDRGVVLTRRIRSVFSEQAPPWPAKPVVLFAHAPATGDLAQSLIDQHVEALKKALLPWGKGKDVEQAKLLTVREVLSANDLAAAKEEVGPSYIHILAHGAQAVSDRRLPQKIVWGLRLGYEREPGVAPVDIARALQSKDGLPLVVTIAACDSANQSEPAFAVHSLVQELHRCGIPVVIGSQLPLTEAGSVVLTRAFYEPLLVGGDVRAALHAARVALFAETGAGHDWLSLVGYVRLPPEGYAEHLVEVGLRAELGMLDAAQQRADRLSLEKGGLADFAEVEALLRLRLESLQKRREEVDPEMRHLCDECIGLLASANKRLAELLFTRGEILPATRDEDLLASRDALQQALSHYRSGYRTNIHNHWLGIQQLALESALAGRFEVPRDWDIVLRAAELERDGKPAEFWACGTIAEAWLLAPVAGQPRNLDGAAEAIRLMLGRSHGYPFAIESTRRQLHRYVDWWTNANGFFPGREDLSQDALRLVEMLTEGDSHGQAAVCRAPNER